MAQHNKLGSEGELIAAKMLLSKGYQILATNWHSGHYELDIIACRDQVLVIVEVKTRSNKCYEPPERAVDYRKIRRIVYATDHYLKLTGISLEVRFDVVTIIKQSEGETRIEHIEDAFYPPLG